jgi:hypothetical protein
MTSELAFGDAERGWYGVALTGADTALAVLFRGQEIAGVMTDASLSVSEERAVWDGPDAGFDVALEPASAPIEHEGGSDQLVRVRGTVRAGDTTEEVDCVGQRSTRDRDLTGVDLVRGISAWLGDGGVVLEALRPEGAETHDAERVWATLVEQGEPVPVADPRLSTTYDGDGHQRRAGMELWLGEDGYPLRAAGEVICGSSLDLGEVQLDLAFFRWRAEGTEGVGRYDILRRR